MRYVIHFRFDLICVTSIIRPGTPKYTQSHSPGGSTGLTPGGGKNRERSLIFTIALCCVSFCRPGIGGAKRRILNVDQQGAVWIRHRGVLCILTLICGPGTEYDINVCSLLCSRRRGRTLSDTAIRPYVRPSVCPSLGYSTLAAWRSCLGYRHAGCLQLAGHQRCADCGPVRGRT